MPDDATGTYHLPSTYFVQAGDDVLPIQHNPPFEDVASALSNRLHADGRRAWEGDQNANNHKITGLKDGVADSDAATVGQAVLSAVPIGAILEYAGATAPPRYMLCYGQAVSRTTYAALFTAIGTTHGAGDGSTTFNLPDRRGRVGVGKDDMGGVAANLITAAVSGVAGNVLGAKGGTQSVTLALSQIPAHAHAASASTDGFHGHTGSTAAAGFHAHNVWTGGAGGHSHSGTTDLQGDHQHGGVLRNTTFTGVIGTSNLRLGDASSFSTDTAGAHGHNLLINAIGDHVHAAAMDGAGSHAHTFGTDGAGSHTHTITVQNAGSGGAHINVQPSFVSNYIIRVQ